LYEYMFYVQGQRSAVNHC